MREPRRDERNHGQMGRGAEPEAGFALILALLALMLLTFLGLTLATSTSTELKIATNYRWQQQALFNAEAGIEAGKRILSNLGTASATPWTAILPTKRAIPWDGSAAPDTATRGGANAPLSVSRNWESGPCDKRGDGVGYGAVLTAGGTTYQYTNSLYGQNLNGAFTLWVRRPTMTLPNGSISDFNGTGDEDHLILVSEGVAPGSALSGTAGANNAAVQVIEVLLSQVVVPGVPECNTRGGQTGQGTGGAGFSGCSMLSGGTATNPNGGLGSLGNAGQAGRGTLGDTTTK
jgi:PilX N-terminal